MGIDPTIIAGCIGAAAVLGPCAGAGLIAWGNTRATIDGLKLRMTAAEVELAKVDQISADVSYIRGVIDGEARAARDTAPRRRRATA